MAQGDETMLLGDDVQATANLLATAKSRKRPSSSAGKTAFLAGFDDEPERYGPSRGTDAERDVESCQSGAG